MNLLNALTQRRLRLALNSVEYLNLLDEISRLKNEALENISNELTNSVQRYLPKVREIRLETRDYLPSDALGPVLIDDGLLTALENKGDGIKSLVTLALIQELARERSQSQGFLLLVDEPEAHLHSNAVHDLQSIFEIVAQEQQVILATHNPIFVNRHNLSSNILVESNAAQPAKSVTQIRDSLGILMQDNLHSAEIVVLLEGLTDSKVISQLLSENNLNIENDIENGRVVFRAIKGTGKLNSHLLREKNMATKIILVFDNDSPGRQSAKQAIDKGLINPQAVFLLGNPSKINSELEDLIETSIYLDELSHYFKRTFLKSHFTNKSVKWSENLQNAFRKLGVAGDSEKNVALAKQIVMKAVTQNAQNAINAESNSTFEELQKLIWSEKQ